jgi:hypothetical protein
MPHPEPPALTRRGFFVTMDVVAMKILVVGAGAVGSVLAKILAKERGVSVTCAANDLAAARRFLGAADRRIRLVKADASDAASIARIAKGSELVVNASLPKFNLKLMRAALVSRANYLDLDSLLKDWRHAEQLTYDKLFAKAGITGLVNAGVSPGLTNLLAAEAADRFSALDTLRFRILEEQDATRFIPSWSANVLKDELKSWPLVLRRGKFAHVRPMKDAETFRFPAPFGGRRVVSVYGDEIATVPLYLPVKNADYKAGGKDVDYALKGKGKGEWPSVPAPDEMRRLVKDGVIRDARLIVSVEASGRRKRGKGALAWHAVFPDIRSIMRRHSGATYIGYPTALCAAAFALAIPSVKRKGVFPAEALDATVRAGVLQRLKSAGARITARPA